MPKLGFPRPAVARELVHEHDRNAGADLLVEELHAVVGGDVGHGLILPAIVMAVLVTAVYAFLRRQERRRWPEQVRPRLEIVIRRNGNSPVPDTLGYRKRIGIVVPSTNTTVQPECEMLRPHGVTNHTARSTIRERPLNTEQAFFEHMEAMREGTGTAIDQIMTTGIDY